MCNIHKSKQYDLIHMFNDISMSCDIFIIDNPELDQHIPDIYPTELNWTKQILQTKKLLSLI